MQFWLIAMACGCFQVLQAMTNGAAARAGIGAIWVGAILEGCDLRGAIYDRVAMASATDATTARRVKPFADLNSDMAAVLREHSNWISSSGFSGAPHSHRGTPSEASSCRARTASNS